jgi:hypothetical protein
MLVQFRTMRVLSVAARAVPEGAIAEYGIRQRGADRALHSAKSRKEVNRLTSLQLEAKPPVFVSNL